jgi:putative intracellular protease/amidase
LGLKVTPDASFAAAPPLDVLLVPGGDISDAEGTAALLSFVQARSHSSREVLSVCTGAFILAGAGVLDGLEATTFTPRLTELARRYPSVRVVKDVRWTDNGRIITSAGLSSGIDAALHVVDRLRGVEQARSVALHLEYDWKPEGGFVRSRMADRYLSKSDLQKAVDWPKDIVLSQRVSIGDEQYWQSRFDVKSSTPADDLMRRIGRGLDSLPGWTREPGKDRWISFQDGHRVALDVAAPPGSSLREYSLELNMSVQTD